MEFHSWYLTFGQSSPLRNGYIRIHVENYADARKLVEEQFGLKWANLYHAPEFDPKFFPDGELGIIFGEEEK